MIIEKFSRSKIREDLKDMKFYFMHKKELVEASKIINENEIIGKIDLYNKIIAKAPIRLYYLYYVLQVLGHTQESLADKICYSVEYISKLYAKLIEFIYLELNK